MGICNSKFQSSFINPDISDLNSKILQQRGKDTDFTFAHTKHYERYCNRQFKVSVCAAKGFRKSMEDNHLCQFKFSNHPHYSLFGIFDGHNGSQASQYLADHLYEILNETQDLENSDNIIAAIQQMDKQFITNTNSSAGSTIVFTIMHDVPIMSEEKICSCNKSEIETDIADTRAFLLPGFEIKHNARIFWCGDARAYYYPDTFDSFDALTVDHNTENKAEVDRVLEMGGNILNARVDGLLSVTRAFGDDRLKYDGSGVICLCECKQFTAKLGDSLLLCCDGLTEKWTDNILMKKLEFNLKNGDKMDTAKAIGDLVDDAIMEGSVDNISVMFIQFKDGRQSCNCRNYDNVN